VIPHSRPWITESDHAVVAAVLQSEMIGQGSATGAFEAAMAAWLGMPAPGVAVATGTAALQLALGALEVGEGDDVILPTYVCRSVLQAVRSVGATAVLADVGPQWVITPANVEPLLNRRTRAIVVPHIYGIFADVAALRTFGVPVVEDCAQALAAGRDRPLRGDVGVYSFHPTKCLTTGEGGLAIARDAALNERLRGIRDGDIGRRVCAPLSDLAAGLGLSQLARYDASLTRRRNIAGVYRAALGAAADRALRRTPWDRTMHFRFVVSSDEGFEANVTAFARMGITVRRGVDELMHRLVGAPDRGFPMATELFDTTVSVPIYPALSPSEVARCADALAAGAWRGAATAA
jgi:UDP-4-amino-4-deoxy-L-arabinose-oxoglutarate aminotransferase